MQTEWWAIAFVVTGTIVGSFGALFLKIGADQLEEPIYRLLFNAKILFSIILYLASTMFYILGLRGGELSVLYPITSLGYVWVSIHSKVFLQETISRYQICGVSFIVMGIALVGLSVYITDGIS
jgi:uncharacterized membrane protein